MNAFDSADQFERLRTLINSKFRKPSVSFDDKSIREALESPLIKDHVFSGNVVAIIDHSINGYRYISESSREVFGSPPEVFMEKGLAYTLSAWHADDLPYITGALERASAIMIQLKPEQGIHVRLNYTIRYNTLKGVKVLFQQTRPLALNDAGIPYLVLALVSDVTEFVDETKLTCNLVLREPSQPPKTLLSVNSSKIVSPLTPRECEVVFHMSEGLDAAGIAARLFISEGTVRTHRKNILEKTGAENSVHLVRIAVANGWI